MIITVTKHVRKPINFVSRVGSGSRPVVQANDHFIGGNFGPMRVAPPLCSAPPLLGGEGGWKNPPLRGDFQRICTDNFAF